MSSDTRRLPETREQYEALMAKSEAYFGDPFTIPERDTRTRVERRFSRAMGGHTLTVFSKEMDKKIRFMSRPYIYRCESVAMMNDKHGSLYTLISLDKGQVSDVTQNNIGWPCSYAVCKFPASGDCGRFYLLPPNYNALMTV
jgi:hypothetical protein